MPRAFFAWVALAALNCAVIMPWLGKVVGRPYDFAALHTAVQVYKTNPHDILYDLRLQLSAQQQLFGMDDAAAAEGLSRQPCRPYELALWLPLGGLPYQFAFWVWRAANIAVLLFAAWLLARNLQPRRGVAEVAVISLAFFPCCFLLTHGQDTLVIRGLFAICLWALRSERYFLAGAALGLGLFKFQFVLPIVGIMVLRRLWRVVSGFTTSASIVLAVSTAMVGFDGMKRLFQLWLRGESGTLVCIDPMRMPNIRGLLASLPGLAPRSPVVLIATLILSALLLFLAARQAKNVPGPEYALAMSVCFVVLVSFHANTYDLALLILPILLMLGMEMHSKQLQWAMAAPRFSSSLRRYTSSFWHYPKLDR